MLQHSRTTEIHSISKTSSESGLGTQTEVAIKKAMKMPKLLAIIYREINNIDRHLTHDIFVSPSENKC